MARSRFMATGVEAGSAIAALQGEVGFERAADLLKALRGASQSELRMFVVCAELVSQVLTSALADGKTFLDVLVMVPLSGQLPR